ncbi:hypothetical protein [Sporosarcina sp. NPDC096371]|uniref:hypothetical protein n=1 Tax=Sporosarcina sp. NPDC096371 TaxID=3364530 RepID=UPI0037FFA727
MIQAFTKSDIFVMLQTLGANTLIGISNPFPNHSKHDIELEWEKVYKKLHRRGLIDFVDDEVRLEERFAEALWIMARTNVTLEIITDQNKQSLFYFGEEHVIECSRVNEEDYTLYMHGDPSTIWNRVIYPRMLLGVEKRNKQSKKSVFIPPSLYKYCIHKGAIANPKEIEKFNANNDTTDVIRRLNHSIKNKIHNNRLMMFYKDKGNWRIEGLHVLTSSAQNWTLVMSNRNGVELLEARQSTNFQIVAEIVKVVRRVSSETIEEKGEFK